MSDPTTSRTWVRAWRFASLRPQSGEWRKAIHPPCVLDLLGQARPQARKAVESII